MMKLSARNQIKGRITVVERDQTTDHVHIDIVPQAPHFGRPPDLIRNDQTLAHPMP